MGPGAGERWSGKATALFLLAATVRVVFADGLPQGNSIQTSHVTNLGIPHSTMTETTDHHELASENVHGIQKRSVSILARNGDLPYFRKEWNKKLHPGFRGMNVEDKDEELAPSKRYVGSLARGGGYPAGLGKRASRYEAWDNTSPEEDTLETYFPEDWPREDMSEFADGKRGGISSLARSKGFVTHQGQYANGKRSVAALARSGELLSIGRGSNQERDGNGGSASKRGLGSILRNGGISTIGKNPVYSLDTLVNRKRGIESLARNYALPSMLNQEYDTKFDLPEGEFEDSDLMVEPISEETELIDDSADPREMDASDLIAKRHLGSFVRTYGFKPVMKRNIGSILRNGGSFGYNGKRSEEFSPYEEYSISNDKRHFSSLLKNYGPYVPYKRGTEGDEEYEGVDKRYLGSVLQGRNAFTTGKRYLGSIARQGLLGSRHDKREDVEWGQKEGPWSRGDTSVGKRSIAEGDVGSLKGEGSFDRQDNSRVTNETAEDEVKNAAGPVSMGGMQKRSTGIAQGDTKKTNKGSSKLRQRRSLPVPYSSSDEYPMPVLQNTDFYDLGNTEEEELEGSPGKRFMGSLDRWGWFPRQFPYAVTPDDGEGAEAIQRVGSGSRGWPVSAGATFQLHKRHIGALARLGWLPAIRSQRRYSRGLGKRSEEEYVGGREDTTHGTRPASHWPSFPEPFSPEAPLTVRREVSSRGGHPLDGEEASGVQWTGYLSLDPADEQSLRTVLAEKRYLLLPAIDNLLLRKLYPRQMLTLLD